MKPRGYRAGTLTRSPHAQANDYRHRYTGTGVDNRTTGTGRHRKDEDGAVRGEILTTTRRGEGTTMTNGRGGDGWERRRRKARGRLRRRSLDEGETQPARGLTTRSRGRRRRRGCCTLDETRAANANSSTEGRTPRRPGTTRGRRRRRPG